MAVGGTGSGIGGSTRTPSTVGRGTGGSSSNAAVVRSRRPRNLPKNAPGQRLDVAWQHGISVDGDPRRIKCKYCEKVFTGGAYRFKQHLACTKKDAEECRAVPDEVRKQVWDIVYGLQANRIKKRTQTDLTQSSEDEQAGDGKKKKVIEIPSPADIFKRGVCSQQTINTAFKKGLKEDVDLQVATFFYNNAIPFNVAKNEDFIKMCEMVARFGVGYKPPSYHDVRVKFLKKKVEETNKILEEHKAVWKRNGCTIMTDGWTDQRRRTILNFLVNSPKGTFFLRSIDASDISKTADKIFKMMDDIVEEVAEENVVQIVTDNAANYKLAGQMLMEKRQKLYWTPCAAHCIDLMLEDFEDKIPMHKETITSGRKITTYIYARTGLISLLHHFTNGGELIRPGITRFATSYLCLGCLNENKGALFRMFTSKQWKDSQFAKAKEGKLVEDIVLDKDFWKNLLTCIRGAYPLLKVLRMVDGDDKPAMGYIYEEMDRAKEKIAEVFNNKKKSYRPLWRIIDKRWDKQMHKPLHAAGYYLNPMFHYSPNFKADKEVKDGLYACLKRMMGGDMSLVNQIDGQLEDFKAKVGFFGDEIAQLALKNKTPAQWWESYGDGHPELQKFAIRVLSLTCSSSGCERNWSAFEMIHTKKRNRLKQKTMNDLVYVMTNSRLGKKKSERRPRDLNIDEFDSDDEWYADGEDVAMVDQNEDSIPIEEPGSNATSAVPVDELDVPNVESDDEGGGDDGGDNEDDDGGDNEDDDVGDDEDDDGGDDGGEDDEINEDENVVVTEDDMVDWHICDLI